MLDLGIREQPVDSFRLMRILHEPGNARRGILNQRRPDAHRSFCSRGVSEVCSPEFQHCPCGRLKCLHGYQPVGPYGPQSNFFTRSPAEAADVGHTPSFLGKDESPSGRGAGGEGDAFFRPEAEATQVLCHKSAASVHDRYSTLTPALSRREREKNASQISCELSAADACPRENRLDLCIFRRVGSTNPAKCG